MKKGELSMLTGSLFYRAIICQGGDEDYFVRVMDKDGFWSQHDITKEKVEEFLNAVQLEKV